MSNKVIRLTDNSVVSRGELSRRVDNGEILYSYFKVNDNTIVVDRITNDNVSLVGEFEFLETTHQHRMPGYLMIRLERLSGGVSGKTHKGKWLFCHKLVDDYNCRIGKYANFNIDECELDDYKYVRHHIDGNKLNNNPDNITRISNREHSSYHSKYNCVFSSKEYIDADYYRKVGRFSRTLESREYGRLLKAAYDMKNDLGEFITEDLYNSKKYEYSKRPARWSRMIEVFGSDIEINNKLDSYNSDVKSITKSNKPSPMKIYIASPFFTDKQIQTVVKLELFLQSRGYETYSPMRDGIKLSPDASKEDRAKVFNENVMNLSDCDLMIANIDDRDTGTMVEIGMKFGLWSETVRNLKDINDVDDSVLTELEKVIINQSTPRIVTYSDDGWDINIMLLGAVIDHCKGIDELNKCLDYIDKVGLNYAERDEDKLSRNRCF